MYYVYVLQSEKDGNWYIGCTADLAKRFLQHQTGSVSSTKGRRPFKIIYSEEYSDKYEAFRAERRYKTAKGKKILKGKYIAGSSNGRTYASGA